MTAVKTQSAKTTVINPLENKLGYQIRRASVLIMHRLNTELAKLAINVSEASVLILVKTNPGIKQSDVGRELGIQRANMTPLINSLTKRHIITKVKLDGRSYGLHITPSSEGFVDTIFNTINQQEEILSNNFNHNQQHALIDSLTHIRVKS